MYQHCFLRPDKDTITHLYMDIEKKERNQNRLNFEHCIFEQKSEWLQKFSNNYPILLHDTEDKHYQEMSLLQKLKQNGILAVRGDDLNELDNKRIEPESNDDTIELHLSQETERMRDVEKEYIEKNEAKSLQYQQTCMLPDWESSKSSRYHDFMSITTNILKTIGPNKRLYDKYFNKLKSVENECLQECSEAVSKELTGEISFPYTGKTNRRTVKRKLGFYEKKTKKKRKK